MRKSKVYQKKASLIRSDHFYSPHDAISLLKEVTVATFNETVEVHFNLGIDPRHADQQLRGTLSLPHGTGKTKIVAVVAEGDAAQDATKAGADFVGSDDLLEKIQGGWFGFDVLITTPNMMRKIGKLGRALGSKGLMPNPKSGTVTQDIKKAVSEFKSGKFEYRNDKEGNLHVVLGKIGFSVNDLLENFTVLYEFVAKIKPAKAKGVYFNSISLCSTQSPSIVVEPMKIKWKE